MKCLRHRTYRIRTHRYKPLSQVATESIEGEDESLEYIEDIDRDVDYGDLEEEIRQKVDKMIMCNCNDKV